MHTRSTHSRSEKPKRTTSRTRRETLRLKKKRRSCIRFKSILKLVLIPLCFGIGLYHSYTPKTRILDRSNDTVRYCPIASNKKEDNSSNVYQIQKEGEFAWTINEYFSRVFVLNLDRRPDRFRKTMKRLERFCITAERIPAEDGLWQKHQEGYQRFLREVPETAQEKKYGRRRYMSAGAWAYQFSAIKAIQLAKERGYENFLLMDDDIRLHKNITAEFNKVIKKVPQTWKVLYLGAFQHTWNLGALTWDNGIEYFYHPVVTDSSWAIGFDKSVFDLLIQEVEKGVGAFDSYPVRAAIRAYPNDSFVLVPNLVIADVSQSDIQGPRNVTELSKRFRWDMSLYDLEPVAEEHIEPVLITVIVTAYNAEATIAMAIRSIQAQTYTNLEIIVVDDASTDATKSGVEQLMEKDTRIKILVNQKNLGTYASRNLALRVSQGEIITFQDVDDVALPDRLEVQMEPIVNGRVVLTAAHCIRSHINSEQFGRFFGRNTIDFTGLKQTVQDHRNHYKADGDRQYCCKERMSMMTSMYHNRVFKEIGEFDAVSAFGGDSEFVSRLMAHYAGVLSSGPHTLARSKKVYSLLQNEKAILHTYERIDDVVLYSIERNYSVEKTIPLWRIGNKLRQMKE